MNGGGERDKKGGKRGTKQGRALLQRTPTQEGKEERREVGRQGNKNHIDVWTHVYGGKGEGERVIQTLNWGRQLGHLTSKPKI